MRFAVLIAALLVLTSSAYAADTCNLARNNRCEEPFVGTGTCQPNTDTTDCAFSYVLPDSNKRLLKPEDLHGMTKPQLRLARNEIFARHGYKFKSADLRVFFGARSWYRPGGTFKPSKIETANLKLIRKFEANTVDGAAVNAPGATPAYSATVKWADGRTGRLHTDGRREYWFVEGENRKRVVVPKKNEVYAFTQGGDTGIVTNIDLFPPASVPALIRRLGIKPQPVGKGDTAGVAATKMHVRWKNEAHSLEGYIWVTGDGISVKVDVRGEFTECCGGEPGNKWTESYELRELDRGQPDPAWFHLPEEIKWSYPG